MQWNPVPWTANTLQPKTRIIGQNGQHLIRVDKEEQYQANIPTEKLLEKFARIRHCYCE